MPAPKMSSPSTPAYLQPYTNAARVYGGGFSALLWASPRTQRARFNALTRIEDFTDRFVLDVGCGRADLLDHLLASNLPPRRYIGVEAVPELLAAARAKSHAMATIIEADFVTDPDQLAVGADLIVFSGSLNTLEEPTFYRTLIRTFAATRRSLAFNFLSSPLLAGQPFLHWRRPADMLGFARSLTTDVHQLADYLDGDCTILLRRREEVQ